MKETEINSWCQVNSDCEGPTCLNDNAFEVCEHFIPHGGEFFLRISRYDDYLVEVAKKEGYKPGDTLKLIAPFLRAYNVTNEKFNQFSKKDIKLVPGANDTFRYIFSKALPSSEARGLPFFAVSTSYQQFAYAVYEMLGMQPELIEERVFCTKLDLDKYKLSETEKRELQRIRKEIIDLPVIEIPEGENEELSDETKGAVAYLDEIFWQELQQMECRVMLEEIDPIGGKAKAEAVLKSLEITKKKPANVTYIGDSITDAEALRFVKEGGGVAVSFNGNRYAFPVADIACITENTIVTSILIDCFDKHQKAGVIELVENHWNPEGFREFHIDRSLVEQFEELLSQSKQLNAAVISDINKENLIKKSEAMRKRVRGLAIGNLG